MSQAERVVNTLKSNGGENYIYNKIYLDAYVAESQGGGRFYPEARKQMFQKLNEGVLYLDYIGHANPVSWTHDGLLHISDLNNMFLKHLPLFYTATCEFTRPDANEVSGGELLFLNSRGGAISLITAARLVYISDNGNLNNYVSRYVFRKDSQGRFARIGDILKNGKNDYPNSNANKLRYMLIGDPAMRLAYPSYEVRLETINDIVVSEDNMPDFMARQTLNMKGSIYDDNGNKATQFNGSIIPTLFDAERSVTTYGHGDAGEVMVFQDRTNKLSVSMDKVVNGDFSLDITIPSEILAPESFDNYSPALVNFYAYSEDKNIEANGSSDKFFIYGYDESVKPPTEGPEIKMFALNSESFQDGDDVNESPFVMATVTSEAGINFSTGGIGHQMTLLLDEKTMYSDVASYFTPIQVDGNGNGGNIYYQLNNLSEGKHTLRLKVWDAFNNSSEEIIEFNVIPGMKPDLVDVYTTSNPASIEANFYIRHNRPDAIITINLQIFDLMGRLVWSTSETGKSDMFTIPYHMESN